jgi:hypothetical protein
MIKLKPWQKHKVKELLWEYHPAEIGKLMNMTENQGKKIVRRILLEDWGYKNWEPRYVGDGYALFCFGSEWIDENGENLIFDTAEQANEYAQGMTA